MTLLVAVDHGSPPDLELVLASGQVQVVRFRTARQGRGSPPALVLAGLLRSRKALRWSNQTS